LVTKDLVRRGTFHVEKAHRTLRRGTEDEEGRKKGPFSEFSIQSQVAFSGKGLEKKGIGSGLSFFIGT